LRSGRCARGGSGQKFAHRTSVWKPLINGTKTKRREGCLKLMGMAVQFPNGVRVGVWSEVAGDKKTKSSGEKNSSVNGAPWAETGLGGKRPRLEERTGVGRNFPTKKFLLQDRIGGEPAEEQWQGRKRRKKDLRGSHGQSKSKKKKKKKKVNTTLVKRT